MWLSQKHYAYTVPNRVAPGAGDWLAHRGQESTLEAGSEPGEAEIQIPHARFIDMLTYKAALVGIQVRVTEEAYTSKASFLDRDEAPSCDPERASGHRLINADVNGSCNIAPKVVPDACDGAGIAAPAVEPIRLAVK